MTSETGFDPALYERFPTKGERPPEELGHENLVLERTDLQPNLVFQYAIQHSSDSCDHDAALPGKTRACRWHSATATASATSGGSGTRAKPNSRCTVRCT